MDYGIDRDLIAHAPDSTDVESEGFDAAVEREEEKILLHEGAFHVGGQYYASWEDAYRQRTLLAERTVRERARARA